MTLPTPKPSQAFCKVSALEAGFIDLQDVMFISPSEPNAVTRVPSLAFIITHSTSNKRILFDLGIRKDFQTGGTPATIKWIREVYPSSCPQDVTESLGKGGLSPHDIDAIILSHLHWDHVGDPSLFSKATFILGAEGETLLLSGYPANPNSLVAQDLVPPYRTQFLKTDGWAPLGPFPRAFNYFGDGSLYIVDAPGHLAGHINVLARTSPDGGWIYLAGDSAHHHKLITGEADVAFGNPNHGSHKCAHTNKALAEEHIGRMRALSKLPRVKVLLAHDEPWYRANQGGKAFWPGCIPPL